MLLTDSMQSVVGDKTAKALHKGLAIDTVEDLLRHYPRRYAERGQLTDLTMLELDEYATVFAEIARVESRPMRGKRGSILDVQVTDGKGRLSLTFFNQTWRERELVVGRHGLFSGKVSAFNNKRQLAHPDYVLVETGELGMSDEPAVDPAEAAAAFAKALIPVYPATSALPSWKVAKCVQAVLDTLGEIPDPVPIGVQDQHDLLGLREAFRLIHQPDSRPDIDSARDRLIFEEAYLLQVELARRRAATASLAAVPRLAKPAGLLAAFDERLPFVLTGGQESVGLDISEDLARSHPMHRLLQGEVGSGKTMVALRAMLTVVDAGGQAALLAPTEVLAQQHFRSITDMLGSLAARDQLGGSEVGTRVALLTGSLGAAAKRQAMLDAVSGDAGIVIGTHALLQERVEFFDLGLVVVDEQHRFGVEQRAALTAKGVAPPHLLVMTATPIPRTVAMTVFGDLDVSTLTELPKGRSPITTHVVPAGDRKHWDRVWARVCEEVADGHQAFVVCARIGTTDVEDDDAPVQEPTDDARRPPRGVLEMTEELAVGGLAAVRIDQLFGRQAPELKDEVMRQFNAGEVDVLVATTVIEVGVDVPNATVMVVLDADRFGVSQLHQLRGRIGRGTAPGLCLLVTDLPPGSPGRARLAAVAATTDGFELSRFDLETRREGDVLGASQSGHRSSLRLLSVLRDEDVILQAREDAFALIAEDPTLDKHQELLAALEAALDPDRPDFLEMG